MLFRSFCALYDLNYGIPRSDTPNVQIKSGKYDDILRALSALDNQLKAEEPDRRYYKFVDASSRHTTDQSQRLIMHRAIVGELRKQLARE